MNDLPQRVSIRLRHAKHQEDVGDAEDDAAECDFQCHAQRDVRQRQLALEAFVQRRRGNDRNPVRSEETEGLDVIDEAVRRLDLGGPDLLQRKDARHSRHDHGQP